ncbi:HNH endonuclease [Lactiplantibacillus plantarum]|uniref:HNH endonuclease n=1 Tax=Lactiplantibacillus plantarum TaxID=1590 RepID=UPI001E3360E4|nr:HNH endonuclease [Lactiplantibacillus plantarum]MCC6112755.1 HNH endonuclease [Lactiplantibacillus plantarum]MCW6129381.1 HNH endonuclease [Lactiplantibacillus plantarum]
MNCIFCGKKLDGSEEHIIPFALGGNLTSKNIICSQTNNALGKLVDIVSVEIKDILKLRGYDFPKRKGGKERKMELTSILELGKNRISIPILFDPHTKKMQLAHPVVQENYMVSDSASSLNKIMGKRAIKRTPEEIVLSTHYKYNVQIDLIKLMMEALKIHCELAVEHKNVCVNNLKAPIKLVEDYLEKKEIKNDRLSRYVSLCSQEEKNNKFSSNSVQVFTYYVNGWYVSVISFFGIFIFEVHSSKNDGRADKQLDFIESKRLLPNIG